MLVSLHVENIALIKKLSLEPNGGFCVFTGETGAGKSIIIDAVNMLCGARSDRDLIRTGEDFALVEGAFGELSKTELDALAEFDIEPDEDGLVFLSRRLSADGKASAKIGGRPVPVSKLRETAEKLIRIHGQQDTRMLSDSSTFITMLDKYANNGVALSEYKTAYKKMTETERELKTLVTDDSEKRKRADYLDYAIKEIEGAKLKPGEEEKLSEVKLRLLNAEKIASGCSTVYDVLYGSERTTAAQLVDGAKRELSTLVNILPELEPLINRLESVRIEIEDVASNLPGFIDDDTSEINAKLDRLEDRLSVIQELKRKYGGSVEAVLQYLVDMKEELQNIENYDEYIKNLSKKLELASLEATKKASELTETRQKAAEELAERMREELEFLDMAKLKFVVDLSPKKLSADGADIVGFLISVNIGEPPKQIDKIASGGELSRIMLALLSVLSRADGAGTLIFDEIDTGISGATSRKIGLKLLGLTESAEPVQVLCVTHSAQIAALANMHLKITKEEKEGRTFTYTNVLDRQGRINELSRIIGGVDNSGVISAAAKELLERKDYDAIKR